jgi:hypothetical protein
MKNKKVSKLWLTFFIIGVVGLSYNIYTMVIINDIIPQFLIVCILITFYGAKQAFYKKNKETQGK